MQLSKRKKAAMLKMLKKNYRKWSLRSAAGAKPRGVKQTAPDIAVYRQLVNFAYNFPVNSLKYEGEYLWPYIRHHLLVQLTAVSIGKTQARNLNPYRLHLGNPAEFDLDRKKEIGRQYGVKFPSEVRRQSVDFLFFTALNASEQAEVSDGKIYYRVTDPIYEVAQTVGTARKIELVRNNTPAIKKVPHYFHKPDLVFSPHIVRTGYSRDVQIKSNFNSFFQRYIPSLECDLSKLRNLIDWELHTRDFFLELLTRYSPKVICVPAFHYYAPLISAAHELGIICVDIQHGIQVGYNPLYNDWSEIPDDGYASLPDYYLVWSEKEEKNIEKVFGSHARAAVIGNLWLRRQIDFQVQLSDQLRSELATQKKVVLLAMQSQTEVPDLFRRLINEASDDVLWIVRMHPKGRKYRAADFGHSKNVLISEEIDRVPLLSILKEVDATLSEGSTVAVEGDELGIPSMIASETGRQNYIKEIEMGKFFFIRDASDFKAALAQVKKSQTMISVATDAHDVRRTLRDILDQANQPSLKQSA
jgi:hypothetical protein